MTPTPPQPPRLPTALSAPLGRSIPVDAEVQRQLTGEAGTLSTQLGRLVDEVTDTLRELLSVRPDLPPRRPHPWTLLTEHESPLWPMLALRHPPALPPQATARLARHLGTAHLAMDVGRCRTWAQQADPREATEPLLLALCAGGEPTWLDLLSAVLTIQAHHLMLHSWGVLAAYVGLQTELRVQAAGRIRGVLGQRPELCHMPRQLAAQVLWASLEPLHGGLPCPPEAEVVALAQAMRTLPERTYAGPLPANLSAELELLLPTLPRSKRRELASRLTGETPTDPHQMTTGILALSQPGLVALWLRRAGEVKLLVCSADTTQAAPQVRAWRWRLPTPARKIAEG